MSAKSTKLALGHEIVRLRVINADLVAALVLARRSMIVSVTGESDGLTVYDIRRWIDVADAALAKATGAAP